MAEPAATSAAPQPLPPDWSLRRPKSWLQSVADFVAAPLRMIALPDLACERMHVTSLRAERLAVVLPELRGRVLDVGAGDNTLVRLYRARSNTPEAADSVGADVVDWGGDCVMIERSDRLPFADASFDTVCYIACLNHIPERAEALVEARRLLRPGGRVIVTMIGRFIGRVGHAIWWYSEDKHREVDEHEEMGLDESEVMALFDRAGFRLARLDRFVYGLNRLYVFEPRDGGR